MYNKDHHSGPGLQELPETIEYLCKRLFLITILFFGVASTCLGDHKVNRESEGQPVGNYPPGIYRNLRYAIKPDSINADTSSDRTLDLYLPQTGEKKKLPVYLFIHGGGFSGGDKYTATQAAICSKISSYGFAVVSINYRLFLKHHKIPGASASANMAKGLPAEGKFHPGLRKAVRIASEDALMALQWIKDNASKFGFNTSKVVISGGSAGAMTALHTAYASGQKVLPIKAVVNFWGGLEDTSVIQKGAPALLTYHGDQDKLINVDYANALKNRMVATGNSESVSNILPGKGHAIYSVIAKEKTGEIAAFLTGILR